MSEVELTEQQKRLKHISRTAAAHIQLIGEALGAASVVLNSSGGFTNEEAFAVIEGILLGSLDIAAKAHAHVANCPGLTAENRDAVKRNASAWFIKQCAVHEKQFREQVG